MKRETILLAAILAVGLLIVIWRQFALEAALQEAQAEWRAGEQAQALKEKETSSTESRSDFSKWQTEVSPNELASLRADAARMRQRIDDLEGTVKQIADLLNEMLDERDQKKTSAAHPGWSAMQACGPPDTQTASDSPTAWASARPDGGEEWLQLGYDEAVPVARVIVRESFNPGAISKVALLVDGGREITIWQGVETAAAAPIDRDFPATGATAQGVKIYLDTKRVPGWNEIDAVAIVGADGRRHWATSASASSSYGESSFTTRTQLFDMLRTYR